MEEGLIPIEGAPQLEELQFLMSRAVRGNVEPFLGWVQKSPPLHSCDRVAIYSDAISNRFESTLSEDFPRIKAILGQDRFEVLARGYLEDYPSRSFNLSNLGHGLSKFLEDFPDEKFPYLSEVARMEWASCQGFWTPEFPFLAPSALASLALEVPFRIFLMAHPSLQIFSGSWPVDEIWMKEAAEILPEVERWTLGTYDFRIHRNGFRTEVRRIDKEESRMLVAVKAGSHLNDVIEEGMGLEPARLSEIFQDWVSERLIVEIRIRT